MALHFVSAARFGVNRPNKNASEYIKAYTIRTQEMPTVDFRYSFHSGRGSGMRTAEAQTNTIVQWHFAVN